MSYESRSAIVRWSIALVAQTRGLLKWCCSSHALDANWEALGVVGAFR